MSGKIPGQLPSEQTLATKLEGDGDEAVALDAVPMDAVAVDAVAMDAVAMDAVAINMVAMDAATMGCDDRGHWR